MLWSSFCVYSAPGKRTDVLTSVIYVQSIYIIMLKDVLYTFYIDWFKS